MNRITVTSLLESELLASVHGQNIRMQNQAALPQHIRDTQFTAFIEQVQPMVNREICNQRVMREMFVLFLNQHIRREIGYMFITLDRHDYAPGDTINGSVFFELFRIGYQTKLIIQFEGSEILPKRLNALIQQNMLNNNNLSSEQHEVDDGAESQNPKQSPRFRGNSNASPPEKQAEGYIKRHNQYFYTDKTHKRRKYFLADDNPSQQVGFGDSFRDEKALNKAKEEKKLSQEGLGSSSPGATESEEVICLFKSQHKLFSFRSKHVPVGQYEFPFTFKLPQKLPSTFQFVNRQGENQIQFNVKNGDQIQNQGEQNKYILEYNLQKAVYEVKYSVTCSFDDAEPLLHYEKEIICPKKRLVFIEQWIKLLNLSHLYDNHIFFRSPLEITILQTTDDLEKLKKKSRAQKAKQQLLAANNSQQRLYSTLLPPIIKQSAIMGGTGQLKHQLSSLGQVQKNFVNNHLTSSVRMAGPGAGVGLQKEIKFKFVCKEDRSGRRSSQNIGNSKFMLDDPNEDSLMKQIQVPLPLLLPQSSFGNTAGNPFQTLQLPPAPGVLKRPDTSEFGSNGLGFSEIFMSNCWKNRQDQRGKSGLGFHSCCEIVSYQQLKSCMKAYFYEFESKCEVGISYGSKAFGQSLFCGNTGFPVSKKSGISGSNGLPQNSIGNLTLCSFASKSV